MNLFYFMPWIWYRLCIYYKVPSQNSKRFQENSLKSITCNIACMNTFKYTYVPNFTIYSM